jgi:hypothetical protein
VAGDEGGRHVLRCGGEQVQAGDVPARPPTNHATWVDAASCGCYEQTVAKRVADVTVEILRDIRDSVRESNVRLEAVRVELKAELEAVRVELKAEIAQTNVGLDRVEKTLAEMAAQLLFLSKFTKNVAKQMAGRLEALE